MSSAIMLPQKDGKRFEWTSGAIVEKVNDGIRRAELWVERRLQYQKMVGFGAGDYTFCSWIRNLTSCLFLFSIMKLKHLRTQPGLTC